MAVPPIAAVVAVSPSLAAAPGDANVTPGEFVIEHPTLINLGFEWHIDGDANRNASVDVSFRKQQETAWRKAMPLARLHGPSIVAWSCRTSPTGLRGRHRISVRSKLAGRCQSTDRDRASDDDDPSASVHRRLTGRLIARPRRVTPCQYAKHCIASINISNGREYCPSWTSEPFPEPCLCSVPTCSVVPGEFGLVARTSHRGMLPAPQARGYVG
jgi:hypothetical protein